jgi:hydroxymethylpyrimidine pyrophosphatase-like HAD family hydrolase
VVLATGRALVESQDAVEAIAHEGIVIAAGGSMVCDAASGRTKHRHIMDRNLVADVTHAILDDNHKALLLKDPDTTGYDYLAVGPHDLDPASQWWFDVMPIRVRFVRELGDDPHPQETVRVGAVATESELAPLAEHIKAFVGDRAFLQHWGAVTEPGENDRGVTHLLEIFSPHVNKWTMTHRLCMDLDIDPARVAAIGDGLNDVELIREAGLGIAMGNADPRVAAVATRTTLTNRENGVAHAIDALLNGEWD